MILRVHNIARKTLERYLYVGYTIVAVTDDHIDVDVSPKVFGTGFDVTMQRDRLASGLYGTTVIDKVNTDD